MCREIGAGAALDLVVVRTPLASRAVVRTSAPGRARRSSDTAGSDADACASPDTGLVDPGLVGAATLMLEILLPRMAASGACRVAVKEDVAGMRG